MNRLLSTATLALILSSSTLFAQAAPKHGHNPHKAAMKMGKKLGLSQEQTAKIEPILAERQSKVQALRADSTLNDAQRHEQMRAIQQNTRSQMGAVLTPEQVEQMKSMRRGRKHGDGKTPAGV